MNSWAQALVIILSITLIVELIMIIWALTLFIKIANHVRHITAKAVVISDKAEEAAEYFRQAAGPLAIGRMISKFMNGFNRGSARGRRKG